jgi:dimethylglycine dehydrogenase
MKTTARVVVIGGGIVGCSLLYHLTKLGWRDVVLVERDELTSGSTWHAAGNLPNFSMSWNIMKMQHYSNRLYARLEQETGAAVTRHVTGSIRLAHTADRMREFHHVVGMAKAQGIGFEMMGPNQIKDRYPFIELDGLEGGLWDPDDGDIDPSQATQALAAGARRGGAEIYRFNPVERLERSPTGEWLVHTKQGTIAAEIVVNSGGYRAGEVARMMGHYLPMVPMQHQYLVTDDIPELAARDGLLPLLRDPDVSYYLRQERKGLLLGPYEWDCKSWGEDGIPPDFGMELLPDDLDRLERYIEGAIAQVPILGSVGIKRVVNGPIPYTPDGNPMIGPIHGLENAYLCCGFSFGIVQGGGGGKAMAELLVEGETEWDLWNLDSRRFGEHATKRYTVARAVELYQHEYGVGYPIEERPAGRPAKTTPLYERLKAKGAQFGARGGWERATWFPRKGETASGKPTFGRAEWFATVGEECRAVRERVGLLDLAGFSKFEVGGPGAATFLDGIIAGALPKPGRIALSYGLTGKGGVLVETTITRLEPDRFYLCSAGSAEWHDGQWLEQRRPRDGTVAIANVTAQFGTLVLAGPRSRDLLAAVTEADLSNAAFPWLSAREIEIGYAKLRALRVNYVGELGWELHVPMAYLVDVYDRLMAAGEPFGIADFGIYAVDSLRLEKGYRGWKSDLSHEYGPDESGLARFVKPEKGNFVGRDALAKRRQQPPKERLVPLLVDTAEFDAPASSIVWQNGSRVGMVSSSGWGYTVKSSISLAFVRSDLANPGTRLEVEIFGEARPAVVAEESLYDPKNARLKA